MSRRVLAAITPLAAVVAGMTVFTGIAHAANSDSAGNVFDEVNGCSFTIEGASPAVDTRTQSKLDLALHASGNPRGGIFQGCAEKFGGGRLITQIVCELGSSAVQNTPAEPGSSTAITNVNFWNGSQQSWCYGRFRFSDGTINPDGTQKWGTEWRIPWTPQEGWGQPMTKEDQQKEEKSGFTKPGNADSFPMYDCGPLVANQPNMGCFVAYGTTKTSNTSAGFAGSAALRDAGKTEALGSLDAFEKGNVSYFGGAANCIDLATSSPQVQSQYAYDSANPNNIYCYSYGVWLYGKKSSQ
ncbi:hypothetical protein [Streptosporangium vulgare]|uniref:Secreted protein n=1 Tax=Streptosporangium vulgare TaxID=46190 RepID=A0ABV5TUT9_9ACTN